MRNVNSSPPAHRPGGPTLVLLSILVGYVPNLLHLFYPFVGDHFILAWLGGRLLHGEWPYVDHVDHAFPGGIILYSLAAMIGPQAVWYRLLDWCWQLGAGLLMFRLAGRVAGPLAGFAAMTLYGVHYGGLHAGDAGNRDPMVSLLYLLSIELLLRSLGASGPRAAWRAAGLVAAGLASSMIVLIKPTHGIWWIGVGGAILWWGWRSGEPPRVTANRLLFYGIGCLAPLALGALAYCLSGHAQALVDCLVRYNILYGQLRRSPHASGVFAVPPAYGLLIALAVSWGMAETVLGPNATRPARLAAIWAGSVVAAVGVQGKYFVYHLVPLTAAVSFWVSVGVAIGIRRIFAADTRRDADGRRDDARSQVPIALLTATAAAASVVYAFPLVQEATKSGLSAGVAWGVQLVVGALVLLVGRRLLSPVVGLLGLALYGAYCVRLPVRADDSPYALAMLVYLGWVAALGKARGSRARAAAIACAGALTAWGILVTAPSFCDTWQRSAHPGGLLWVLLATKKLHLWHVVALPVAVWGIARLPSLCGWAGTILLLGWPATLLIGSLLSNQMADAAVAPLVTGLPLWVAVGTVELTRGLAAAIRRVPPARSRPIVVGALVLVMVAVRLIESPTIGTTATPDADRPGRVVRSLPIPWVIGDWSTAVRYLAGRAERRELIGRFVSREHFDVMDLAAVVRERAEPNDQAVFFAFFGCSCALHYMSGLTSPSRFVMPRLICPFWEASADGGADKLRARWRGEYERAVLDDPPRFMALRRGNVANPTDGANQDVLEMMHAVLPRIRRMLAEEYSPVTVVGKYELYERTRGPRGPLGP